MTTTEDRIKRAEELDKAATPGPWIVTDSGSIYEGDTAHAVFPVFEDFRPEGSDAMFAAESRTLLLALAADLKTALARLAAIDAAALPEGVAPMAARHAWCRPHDGDSVAYYRVGIDGADLDGYTYTPDALTDALLDRATLLCVVRALVVERDALVAVNNLALCVYCKTEQPRSEIVDHIAQCIRHPLAEVIREAERIMQERDEARHLRDEQSELRRKVEAELAAIRAAALPESLAPIVDKHAKTQRLIEAGSTMMATEEQRERATLIDAVRVVTAAAEQRVEENYSHLIDGIQYSQTHLQSQEVKRLKKALADKEAGLSMAVNRMRELNGIEAERDQARADLAKMTEDRNEQARLLAATHKDFCDEANTTHAIAIALDPDEESADSTLAQVEAVIAERDRLRAELAKRTEERDEAWGRLQKNAEQYHADTQELRAERDALRAEVEKLRKELER